jgi:hypothetical protein
VNKRHYAAMSECNIQVVFDGSNERSNRVVTSSAKRTRIEPGFVEPNHYDTTLGDIYVQKTPRIIPRPRENRKAEAEENIRGNMKKKENRKKRRQYRRLPLDHPEAAIVKLVNLDPSGNHQTLPCASTSLIISDSGRRICRAFSRSHISIWRTRPTQEALELETQFFFSKMFRSYQY